MESTGGSYAENAAQILETAASAARAGLRPSLKSGPRKTTLKITLWTGGRETRDERWLRLFETEVADLFANDAIADLVGSHDEPELKTPSRNEQIQQLICLLCDKGELPEDAGEKPLLKQTVDTIDHALRKAERERKALQNTQKLSG